MLSKWQRVVLLVGLVVAMGLALFPPHLQARRVTGGEWPWADVTERTWLFGGSPRILWGRLALEEAVVVVATVAVVLWLRERGGGKS